eukprot:TRINITY_DN61178_c0_g1_i1.p1 TRINITY_DN61178_c0_g1~~TRINITY_DN61178_c0_g1_i1.p1  ORF type:complete len:565 (-),score=133.14 TRINITY_DN61178_c0_g1_i1:11-1705(-)
MEDTLRTDPLTSRNDVTDKENTNAGRCIKNSNAWLQMREVERLRHLLAQEESRCAQAEAELRRRGNRKTLAQPQEDLREPQEFLTHSLSSLQRDNAHLREECSKLSELLLESRKAADAAQSQWLALEERAECAENKLLAFEERPEFDESTRQALQDRAQDAERKLLALEQSTQDARSKCQAAEERAVMAEMQCQTLREHRQCLKGRWHALEERAHCAESEVRRLKTDLEDRIESNSRAAQAWQVSTEEEAKRHRAEIQQLSDECVNLRAESHNAEQLVETMKQEASKEAEQNKQSIESLQLEIRALKQECERLSQDAESSRRCDPPPGGLSHAELLQRNRELLLTIEQFKQDCEAAERENASLRDTVASFEQSLERVAGENAQLMGHVNHKQKIRYTMKLKDENLRLREELRQAKHKAATRDATSSRCEGLFEALAAAAAFARDSTTAAGHSPAAATQKTASPARAGAGRLSSSSGSSRVDAPLACLLRCEEQERVLESVRLDFLHLRTLIERAVSGEDPTEDTGGDIITLLERLRLLVAQKGSSRSHLHVPMKTVRSTISKSS